MKTLREFIRRPINTPARMSVSRRSMIEPLEARVAPAAVFGFIDVEGDHVTVSSSKGTGIQLAAAATVVAGQLTLLDLTAAAFQGANISITAVRDPVFGGDGMVNVGRINATGHDLGSVFVEGDLAVLDAGDGVSATSAVKALTVGSLGRYGTTTGSPDLQSDIDGRFDILTIKTDLRDAAISVTDSGGGGNARIGSLKIGGSLIAGLVNAADRIGSVKITRDLLGGTGVSTGVLTSSSIGSITIGGSFIGGSGGGGVINAATLGAITIGGDMLGGAAASSGVIAGGTMGPLTIKGGLHGGVGNSSGVISAATIGPVKIGGDLAGGEGGSSGIIAGGTLAGITIGGSFNGGKGVGSGTISSGGNLGTVKIGGSLAGGDGNSSGVLAGSSFASLTIGGSLLGGLGNNSATVNVGTQGPVKIAGNLIGGDGSSSAIISGGTLAGLTIGGSMFGGFGANSATISAGTMGKVSIGRDFVGGDGANSAQLAFGTLTGLTVGGAFLGGDGASSGLLAVGTAGPIKIGRDFAGGHGVSSGSFALGAAGSLTIGGSLLGGTMNHSGEIVFGTLGAVKIGQDIVGGGGDFTGWVNGSSITSLTIGGSLIGSSFAGASHNDTGNILVTGALGPVKIGRDIVGGSISGFLIGLGRSGAIEAGRIASLTVGGSIISGTAGAFSVLTDSGSVTSANDIGPIVIKGNLIGNGTQRVQLTARGQFMASMTVDVAIKSLTIGGSVESADILAGYDPAGVAVNANAQIGLVSVGGDWVGSNLVAGAQRGGDGFFGTFDDDQIGAAPPGLDPISRIAGITIKGQVVGSPGVLGDQFGFVAEHLVSLKVGGTAFKLTAGPNSPADFFIVGGSLDVLARELV